MPLTILFNNFWLCLLKLLVTITVMSVKYLSRFLPYFLITSSFLWCVYCVFSVLHASYLYICFVNIFVSILTEISIRLSNLFCTNSFIFVDVNVDVKIAMHSDLVIYNNFINYKVLPAFDFHFRSSEFSQLLQTDMTPFLYSPSCLYVCFLEKNIRE